jgi:hypothetical protein
MQPHLLYIVGLFFLSTAVVAENANGNFDDDEILIENDDELNPAEEANSDGQYTSPKADTKLYYFADHFDDKEKFFKDWIRSQAKKGNPPLNLNIFSNQF